MGATWNSRRGELEAEVDANANEDADAREGVIQTARAIGSAEGGRRSPRTRRASPSAARAPSLRARKYLRSKNKQRAARLAASRPVPLRSTRAVSGARRTCGVARLRTACGARCRAPAPPRPARGPPRGPAQRPHARPAPAASASASRSLAHLARLAAASASASSTAPDASRAFPSSPSCSGLSHLPVRRWHGKSDVGEEKHIITAYGPDRPGLVSSLAKAVFDAKGNVENTRMARLGNDCNVMMLVSFANANAEDHRAFAQAADEIPGLTVKVRPTRASAGHATPWTPRDGAASSSTAPTFRVSRTR